MGGKSSGSKGNEFFTISNQDNWYGEQFTKDLKNINDDNYRAVNPLAQHLSGMTQGNSDALSQYGRNVVGPNGQIMQTAQGLKDYAGQSVGAGYDIYNQGLGYGRDNAQAGWDVYNQGLNYADGAMDSASRFISSLGGMAGAVSQPNISLGSVTNGTTAAGGNAEDYFNEWKNVYAPAARQQLSDAQNFNTAGYREVLARQAASDAAMQFQNAQAQNMRSMASMGINPNSGAAMGLQNQTMLANAAQRAGAATNAGVMAEQEGWNRVNTAMNNTAGQHLMGAANDALGVEASVTNTNTNAQASVANANTAAQASMANNWVDSQSSLANARMGAAASVFNAGLDAQSRNFATGSGGLFQGLQNQQGYYGTASQGLLSGLNQGMQGYNYAGGLQVDAGKLGIDAARAANESAGTSLGLAMTPREQYFQNYLSALQPQMWGREQLTNGAMNRANVKAGAEANNAGLTGSIIGGLGAIGSGFMSGGGASALLAMSDRRAKQDIVQVGAYDNGLPMYEFAYRDDPQVRYRGVMADEVAAFMPEAVLTGADGYQRVDYGKLGITMERV